MIKYSILLILLALTTFLSCSKENTQVDSLVGKWKVIERIQDGESSINYCDEYRIIEYDSNLIRSNYIIDSAPSKPICGILYLVQWNPIGKIDENNYIRTHPETGAIIKYTVEGNILIKERVDSNEIETLEKI